MVCFACPGVGSVYLEATSLTAYRPGQKGRRLWNIQVTDLQGEYVGETLWDIEDGWLESATWDRPTAARPGFARLSPREVWEMAKLRLIQMEAADGGILESSEKPVKTAREWIVWCVANGAKYRVKLDAATGLLRSTERRDQAANRTFGAMPEPGHS
jgi:hypothetical protein